MIKGFIDEEILKVIAIQKLKSQRGKEKDVMFRKRNFFKREWSVLLIYWRGEIKKIRDLKSVFRNFYVILVRVG